MTQLLRTRPHSNCLLCGSLGTIMYSHLSDHLFGVAGEWTLRRCHHDDCGLAWLDPMPLIEDITLAYENYYTHTRDPQLAAGWWRRFDYALYRRLNQSIGKLTGLYQQQQQAIQLFLPSAGGKLLDVGCGNGRFLHHMFLEGWDVEGTDFDPDAAASVRAIYGLKVRTGDLIDIAYPANHFDVVTLQHSIEHIPNPIALLKECYRILKPSGKLVIVTPNLQSWGHQHFKACWRGLEPPRHLYLYSAKNLKNLVIHAGFVHDETKTTATGAEYILGSSQRIQAYVQQRKPPQTLLFSSAWILQYYELWLLRRHPTIGEELYLTAEKP